MIARPTWTDADAAELDVLIHALAFDFWEHREHCEACNPEPCPELEGWYAHKTDCRACQGDAPLMYGPPCTSWRDLRCEHGRTCLRCNPCPYVRTAVSEVLDWRAARMLLTRAQVLRADVDEAAA